MLLPVVRNRKCSHGFFKSICKQCKQSGVRGGGSQLCKHFVRRSYCTKCSPGMQRCKLHPEKTKALCLKCAHLKGHGSSLCRCVFVRCTQAHTHSPHTYFTLSLLSLYLSLSLPLSLCLSLSFSASLSLAPSLSLTFSLSLSLVYVSMSLLCRCVRVWCTHTHTLATHEFHTHSSLSGSLSLSLSLSVSHTVQTIWCPWGRITALQAFCAPLLLHKMFSGNAALQVAP